MITTTSLPSGTEGQENFPDTAFRSIVSGFDTDNSGALTTPEIMAVTEISARSKDIAVLTGIEHFAALVTLDVRENKLTALDVSKNSALTSLLTDGQVISGVKVVSLENAKFAVKVSDYVKGDLAKINSDSLKDCEYSNGTATFTAYPSSLSYEYDTGFTGEGKYMTVTLVTEPQPDPDPDPDPDPEPDPTPQPSAQEQQATDNSSSGETTNSDDTNNSGNASSPDVAANTTSNEVKSYTAIPVNPELYDETTKSSGLSVSPRFFMPRDPSPDIYSALSSLSNSILPLVGANFLASRDAAAVFREISHDLINQDTPQVLAVVLPVFSVSNDAVYVLRVPVDNITASNTPIFWHSFEQSGSSEISASALGSEAWAVFLDDNANFANVIDGEMSSTLPLNLRLELMLLSSLLQLIPVISPLSRLLRPKLRTITLLQKLRTTRAATLLAIALLAIALLVAALLAATVATPVEGVLPAITRRREQLLILRQIR